MTLEQIEELLLRIQAQVKSNTNSIETLQTKVDNRATKTELSEVKVQVNTLSENITNMQTQIGFVNKLSKLIDVDLDSKELAVGDTLRYDGDRWTNFNLDNMVGGSATAVTMLSDLTDVNISGTLSDKQALCYDVTTKKWINMTVNTNSGTGTTGFDVNAMWTELNTVNSARLIDPSHIAGDLTVNSITVTGVIPDTTQSINTSNDIAASGEISAVGNITSQSGVAALKEHEA